MGRATSLPEGGVREASVREALADQDALHLWATILQHGSIRVLGVDPAVIAAAPRHAFISLSAALTPERCDPSKETVQAFGPSPPGS